MRRDGFVSMGDGPAGSVQRIGPAVMPGTLTTRPVRFTGSHLFVNVDASAGELRAEVLDQEGRTLPQFTSEACVPVREDSTRAAVVWRSADLTTLRGQAVRFRFHLTRGRLYAFWVSTSGRGASRGFVAAGGPGFTGIADT